MYKVIKLFADLNDGCHVYNPGDVYPREGVEVSDERIKELSGSLNKRGEPLIELTEDAPAAATKPAKKGAKKTANKQGG